MTSEFHSFNTWHDVVRAALGGDRLWYQAPMERFPRSIRVVKVFKNGNIRIDPMSSGIPNFTADKGHLSRFLHKGSPDPKSPADIRRDLHAAGIKV